MTFYSGLADTASRLVQRFGLPMTLNKLSQAEYDPASGEFLDTSATTFAAYGVRAEYRKNEIDGTRIQAGDARVFMSVILSGEPAPGDGLVIEGQGYFIVQCSPIKPGPFAVLYDIQARAP